jgi:hypothetical protein
MKYRKKPIVIEAFQYIDCVIDIPWLDINIPIKEADCCYIETLEGLMRCNTGDYIIKGIEGEFYSCKESIFLESYERIGEA